MKTFKIGIALSAAIFLFSSICPVSAKKEKKDAWNFRYEIQCSSTGQDGMYVVQVSNYSKSKKFDPQEAGMCAVHGIIFKGVAASGQGCPAQPALVRNPSVREEQSDYFEKFFAPAGDYSKYIMSVSDKVERIKIRKEWKYTSIIQVAKDHLRKDLEAAGIIKGLSSGF